MITMCIESPLAGDFTRNIAYARAALRYCLEQDVSPYASHLLLAQVFNDLTPEQRAAGVRAGLEMGNRCDERWYFIDFGMSSGMERALWESRRLNQPEQFIKLGPDWATKYAATPTPGFTS